MLNWINWPKSKLILLFHYSGDIDVFEGRIKAWFPVNQNDIAITSSKQKTQFHTLKTLEISKEKKQQHWKLFFLHSEMKFVIQLCGWMLKNDCVITPLAPCCWWYIFQIFHFGPIFTSRLHTIIKKATRFKIEEKKKIVFGHFFFFSLLIIDLIYCHFVS